MKINYGQDLLIGFILFVAIAVFYIYYIKGNNTEEHFAVCTNAKDYSGNPMTLRDGSNISYSPELKNGVDTKNAILGYKSGSVGWEANKGDEYIITFKTPMNLKGFIVGGFGAFNAFVDVFDPQSKMTQWYQVYDNLRETGNDIFSSGESSVGYQTQQLSNCFDIQANKTTDIICKRIKFRSVTSGITKAQFEVYGMELDASPKFKDAELLNQYADTYDENNEPVADSKGAVIKWTGEPKNKNPFFKVQFVARDTVPIVNKLVYYIDFSSHKNTWITSYNISHKHNGSDVTRHVANIVGNAGNSDTVRHYFKYPILASELTIKPTTVSDVGAANPPSDKNKTINPSCTIEIYGKIIKSEKEDSTIKAEQETYYRIGSSQKTEGSCPPVGQLIGKQAELQQLCSALEQSDEIEYEKKKIDKNRLYLVKLEKQKKEIKELEKMINKIRDANKYFDQVEDRNKLAIHEYQEKIDAELQKLVKERLAKQSAINFNLAVKDSETLVKKPDVVETFQNKLSKTFQTTHATKTPPANFYEEFIGNPYQF
jgi:hypothetical protein